MITRRHIRALHASVTTRSGGMRQLARLDAVSDLLGLKKPAGPGWARRGTHVHLRSVSANDRSVRTPRRARRLVTPLCGRAACVGLAQALWRAYVG